MGNPAAGILVLLLAVFLLLSYFTGRLEWLFRLSDVAKEPGGPGDAGDPGDEPATAVLWRPGSVWSGWAHG